MKQRTRVLLLLSCLCLHEVTPGASVPAQYDVRDFGAKLDGITDDTFAFRAAIVLWLT